MSGANLYYTQMLDAIAAAGVPVGENDITKGWQQRARSSGGFPAPPLGVWWHHTASQTSVESDLTWMIRTCPDAPVGNLLIARDGRVYPIAAGASNCAGKGGPWTFSRGVCAKDQGNVCGFQVEMANGGTGEPYPVAQIDSMFIVSAVLNGLAGNLVTDIVGHAHYAPDRKIDPAKASAVLV